MHERSSFIATIIMVVQYVFVSLKYWISNHIFEWYEYLMPKFYVSFLILEKTLKGL
jgi:hypothetical protein